MFGDHLNISELQWPWHDRFQILKEMRQRRQRMIMLCALCYISTIHHLVAVIASAALMAHGGCTPGRGAAVILR